MENKKSKIVDIPVLENDKCKTYDVDHLGSSLDGFRPKKFYRVSTELLSEIIDEIKNNPESSYITHCNDLIKNHDYVPKYMSVMAKGTNPINSLKEIACSRLMNYFGSPTTYEKVFKLPDERFSIWGTPVYATVSPDFVSFDYELMTLDDFGIHLDMDLEKDISVIDKALSKFYSGNKYLMFNNKFVSQKDFDIRKTEIIADYIYAFLIRKFVLRDRDFHSGNTGIIINPITMDMKSYVSFDYEATLSIRYEPSSYAYEQIKYVLLMYPDVFRRFQEKLDSLLEINKDKTDVVLVEMLNRELPKETEENNKDLIKKFYDNVIGVNNVCENVIREVCMGRANYERLKI